MRRRNFIAGLGVAAALPLAARAQRQLPVIGMLNSGTVEPRRDQIEWFQRGLKEAGFTEGENVIIAKRSDVLSPRMIRIMGDLSGDWRRLDERIEHLLASAIVRMLRCRRRAAVREPGSKAVC